MHIPGVRGRPRRVKRVVRSKSRASCSVAGLTHRYADAWMIPRRTPSRSRLANEADARRSGSITLTTALVSVVKEQFASAQCRPIREPGPSPLSLGGSAGSSGWITLHSSSLTNGLLITGQRALPPPGFCTGGSGGIISCRAAVSGSSAKHSPQPVGHDAPNVGTKTCLIGHEFEHAKHLEGMDASR
jgi:hypothetical protein